MNNDVVMIKLDRERQLKFTNSALKTFVDLTGKTLEEIDKSFDLYDFDLVEQAIYCGLLYDARKIGEELSIEKVQQLLDEAPSQAHVWERLVAAWGVAFGAPANPAGNSQEPETQPAKK